MQMHVEKVYLEDSSYYTFPKSRQRRGGEYGIVDKRVLMSADDKKTLSKSMVGQYFSTSGNVDIDYSLSS